MLLRTSLVLVLICPAMGLSQPTPARTRPDTVTAPSTIWVATFVEIADDDQPVERKSAMLEAGWAKGAHQSATIRWGEHQYDRGVTLRIPYVEVSETYYWSSLNLESSAALAVLNRRRNTVDWTGHVALGLHLPHHLTARLRGEREVYFETRSSLHAHIRPARQPR